MSDLPYGQCLTNEQLSKQSKSQFELVGRAIKIADYLVRSGKAASDWPDNVAAEVLRCIAEEGIDSLEHRVMQEGE
jgi:hypothetical protein